MDDALGHGTPGEKFAANVRAIRCLKRIEAEEDALPHQRSRKSFPAMWDGADCRSALRKPTANMVDYLNKKRDCPGGD